MGYLAAGPGKEGFNVLYSQKSQSHPNLDGLQTLNVFYFWISSQFRQFANDQIQQSKELHKDVQRKKAPINRSGGGGPAEYPGVHLKEAILIPIVLLPVIPLQACTWLEYTCMWSCWNAHGWNTNGWNTHGWSTHGWNTDGQSTHVCAHTRIVSPSHSPQSPLLQAIFNLTLLHSPWGENHTWQRPSRKLVTIFYIYCESAIVAKINCLHFVKVLLQHKIIAYIWLSILVAVKLGETLVPSFDKFAKSGNFGNHCPHCPHLKRGTGYSYDPL